MVGIKKRISGKYLVNPLAILLAEDRAEVLA